MKKIIGLKKSFTLVEMLLVTSLMALIGAVLFHSLINGLRVWQVSTRFSVEEDIAIFLDKLNQDLRNSANFSLIPFDGRDHQIRFATTVRILNPASGLKTEYISQLGKVDYEFDSLRNSLLRRQGGYGQATKGKLDPARRLLENVKHVKFSYYVMDGERKVLRSRIKDGQWPTEVLVEIGFAGPADKTMTISRLIAVPAGNRL